MHGNKGVIEDLQCVFENSALTIRKNLQIIKKNKKSSTSRRTEYSQDISIVNYKINHLQNFSSECSSGVILVIEDATAFELHREIKEVQRKIGVVVSPIGSETKLQKCIRQLSVIVGHVDVPELKESLSDVISTLKSGGLKKPKLNIQSDECNMEAITSILDMPNLNIFQRNISVHEQTEFVMNFDAEISLEQLRN